MHCVRGVLDVPLTRHVACLPMAAIPIHKRILFANSNAYMYMYTTAFTYLTTFIYLLVLRRKPTTKAYNYTLVLVTYTTPFSSSSISFASFFRSRCLHTQ